MFDGDAERLFHAVYYVDDNEHGLAIYFCVVLQDFFLIRVTVCVRLCVHFSVIDSDDNCVFDLDTFEYDNTLYFSVIIEFGFVFIFRDFVCDTNSFRLFDSVRFVHFLEFGVI